MIRSSTADGRLRGRTTTRRSPLRQKKVLIVGAIILVAVGYLVFTSMRDTMLYYLTVGELLGKGEAAYGEQVRLAGRVLEGSVESQPKAMTLRFAVSDGSQQIPVLYKGVVPDAFKDGGDVVVEGKLTRDGVFEARTLRAKCPSKYSTSN